MDTTASLPTRMKRIRPPQIIAGALLLTLIGLVLWASYVVLSDRNMAALRNRAVVRSTLYANSIGSVLNTYTVASTLMAQDRLLLNALSGASEEQARFTIAALQSATGASSIALYTAIGTTVADTQSPDLQINHANAPYFQVALETDVSVFATVAVSDTDQRFYFSRRIMQSGTILGVVVLEVDLTRLQREWLATTDQVFVTNDQDLIILSSRDDWRYRSLSPFLDPLEAQIAARFTLLPMLNLDASSAGPRVEIDGEVFLRVEQTLDFRGWTMTYLAPVQEARARTAAVVALEVMMIALLAAFAFYIASRRAAKQSLRLQRESEELRALNARLTSEIEERLRVEQSLQIAEESLEQSSKLAALGQMSAAISHELNQPLAAMKTYLAGARLLMQRNRPDEAMSSFQRIDDLITRMGAITRQLKSFARKGGTELAVVELSSSISAAISIMSPQIGQNQVAVLRNEPSVSPLVYVDTMRLEQIFINLFRNAIDAMRSVKDPTITVDVLEAQSLVRIQIRDIGPGFDANPNELFEPFFTTKSPGEGVGLGLAISAGIARDMGGNLTARNAPEGGAIFELSLPLAQRPVREI